MKIKHLLFALPILMMLAGSSCSPTRPDADAGALPEFPPNTLTECPELALLITDAEIDGILLKNFYIAGNDEDKQYADCATIHNQLVRFIKAEQEKRKKK